MKKKCILAILKNTYIDKLDGRFNRYNNTYHRAMKIMMKILNLRLMTMQQYQNIKIFLQKAKLQIDLKKFL